MSDTVRQCRCRRGKLHRIITAQDMKGCVRSLHEGRVHALAVDAHSQKRGYIFQVPTPRSEAISSRYPPTPALRSPMQQGTISGQFVPGVRVIVFEFGVYVRDKIPVNA
eukprot:220943-Rhodomonas_salina.1